MVQVNHHSRPRWVTPQTPRLIDAAGFSGSMTVPEFPFSGFSGFSGYSRQAAGTPDLGEILEVLDRKNATLRKLASLADACLRRLTPEARADAFREVREGKV